MTHCNLSSSLGDSSENCMDDDDEDSVMEALEVDQLEQALNPDYVLERDTDGHVMANYLHKLNAHFGNDAAKLLADQHWTLLQRLFPETKHANIPRAIDRTIASDVDKLIAWADSVFGSVRAWPSKDAPDRVAKIEKTLHAIRRGVKYCLTETARSKYLVTLGPHLKRGPSEELLDTKRLKQHYRSRNNYLVGGVIWVLGMDDRFYSHASKHARIHHSTFFGGAPIRAGGEWQVENGKLCKINGESGHYKPDISHFVAALSLLCNNQVLGFDDEFVQVWRRSDDKEELVSLRTLKIDSRTYRAFK